MSDTPISLNLDALNAANLIQHTLETHSESSFIRAEVKLKKRKITINLTPLNLDGNELIERLKNEILQMRLRNGK